MAEGIVSLVLLVALFALYVYSIYWTYKDAQRKGSDHVILWTLIVVVTGFGGLLVYWTYQDAKLRNENKELWALGVLFFGIFALIPYLILRGEKKGGNGGANEYDGESL